VKGTIDFRYDFDHDVVISRPRWTIDSSSEVMRWYQLHANYFGPRFKGKKDLIVVNDAFDVLPKVATLWGSYRAKLHESFVRFTVPVSNNPRVRLTTNTSGVRYSVSTNSLEAATVEEAVDAILAVREAKGETKASVAGVTSISSRPPPRPTTERPTSSMRLRSPEQAKLAALVSELMTQK
jgi:hypothetical protein